MFFVFLRIFCIFMQVSKLVTFFFFLKYVIILYIYWGLFCISIVILPLCDSVDIDRKFGGSEMSDMQRSLEGIESRKLNANRTVIM